ncbi:MAG: TetR/AcrR family transcriptional regulator [Tissierellia bacterium]|nr:TetR/AcrR family transcriptional regulator [Tissierellia bacterium]
MEDKRENIIRSAIEEFSKYGYHGTRMENIAKRAGIGKGTIYGYFDSKKTLFYEMIKHGIDEYIRGLNALLSQDKTLEEKLYDIYDFHKSYLKQFMDFRQVIMREREVLPKELMVDILKDLKEIPHSMEKAIKEAIQKGELRKDLNPGIAATIIMGSMGQFYGNKVFSNEDPNSKEIGDLIDTLLRGLK